MHKVVIIYERHMPWRHACVRLRDAGGSHWGQRNSSNSLKELPTHQCRHCRLSAGSPNEETEEAVTAGVGVLDLKKKPPHNLNMVSLLT